MDRMSSIPNPPNGIAALAHLGVIRLQGEDAAKFIHGQLTQDFALLGPDQARLTALCTAKGRMVVSMVGIKPSASEVLLVCSQDMLAATIQRLSMFVLRAKVRISDASAELALYGRVGAATASTPGLALWGVQQTEAGTVIQLPAADGVPRQMELRPSQAAAPAGPSLPPGLWAWTEVRSAVATVGAAVSEAFVPQMLNYESVGGVSFKKGCYPGQEVVARSQFRGTLKRRAFLAHFSQAVSAADPVVDAADPEQPVGMVVQSAESPEGGFDAIVSMQLEAAHKDTLHARDGAGPRLQCLPLPYHLLEDV
jgi:folate-binding protein YgfZ